MCLQTFELRKLLHYRTESAQPLGRQLLGSDVLAKRQRRDAAVLPCVPGRGEGVVRSRCIVATALRAERAYKHGAGVPDAGQRLAGVIEVQDEMLGRIVVAELHRFFQVPAAHDERLGDGDPGYLHAGQGMGLVVDFPLDLAEVGVGEIDAQENDLRIWTVLCLGE